MPLLVNWFNSIETRIADNVPKQIIAFCYSRAVPSQAILKEDFPVQIFHIVQRKVNCVLANFESWKTQSM